MRILGPASSTCSPWAALKPASSASPKTPSSPCENASQAAGATPLIRRSAATTTAEYALASWGLVLALAGFHYDGRAGSLAFDPPGKRGGPAGFEVPRAVHLAFQSSCWRATRTHGAKRKTVARGWVGTSSRMSAQAVVPEPAGGSWSPVHLRSRACSVPGSTSCKPPGSQLREHKQEGASMTILGRASAS